MRFAAFAALLVPLASLPSCHPAANSVAGQVFIVTRGGEPVRLALVKVRAVPLAQAEAFLSRQRSRARDSLSEARPAYRLLNDGLQRRMRERDSIVKAEPLANMIYSADDNETWGIDPKTLKAVRAIIQANAATAPRLDSLRQLIDRLTSAEYYLDAMPAETLSTTDADGRFLLPLKHRVDYVVVAQSQRIAGGYLERYNWAMRVDVAARNHALVLSNDNLVEMRPQGGLLMGDDLAVSCEPRPAIVGPAPCCAHDWAVQSDACESRDGPAEAAANTRLARTMVR